MDFLLIFCHFIECRGAALEQGLGCRMTLSRMTLGKRTLSRMTLGKMTLSRMTLGKMTLSRMTLSRIKAGKGYLLQPVDFKNILHA